MRSCYYSQGNVRRAVRANRPHVLENSWNLELNCVHSSKLEAWHAEFIQALGISLEQWLVGMTELGLVGLQLARAWEILRRSNEAHSRAPDSCGGSFAVQFSMYFT